MSSQEVNNYESAIKLQRRPTGLDHLYPRPDLENLDYFLNKDNLASSNISSRSSPTPPVLSIREHFLVIHDVLSGSWKGFGSSIGDNSALSAEEAIDRPVLIFMRGHASPSWLRTIARVFDASYELYRRHMDFEAFKFIPRELYCSPGLPSASNRVFQLLIPSLCFRSIDRSSEPENLQSIREQGSEKMRAYFRDLRSLARVGDSVVRKYVLLSKQAYTLEQKATIEVVRQTDTWRALVWLDSGRDLSQSVCGPWNPPKSAKAWETYVLPVIVSQKATGIAPSMTQSKSWLTVENDQGPSPSPIPDASRSWKASQNVCMLPFQYGQQLDKDLAGKDALYALSELFLFAATAEVQFLNLIQSLIEHELSFIGDARFHAISLLNLRYIKAQLSSHERHLSETVNILQNRQWLGWPSSPNGEAKKTAAMLITNYQFLVQLAKNLGRDTEQGMATLANASVLDESRRSANNAMRVQRLTVLATVFIPLSFVCAVWGMNFKEMGTGILPMWWWVVTAVPVLILSLVIFFSEAIRKYFKF
ncbi:hypothetical protein NW768_004709 [Fusarium equiseti]|uniref:Uncharacterized protein n=1 Tax=Fusarium equiseti TaxID=61235 RepID=A0ABQ8RH25_FUSEQ|nr:hypothetical protein NW768_004709 [Fusarium equiseti]